MRVNLNVIISRMDYRDKLFTYEKGVFPTIYKKNTYLGIAAEI